MGLVMALLLAGAQETEMGKLAAGMRPGTWAELKTEGIVEALRADGASGAIFGYSEDGAWDPETRRFLYLGGDHNGTPRLVSYSADDNRWRTLPQPAWIGRSTMHGYDHNAIDPAARVFYHFPFGNKARTVRRFDLAREEWGALPLLDPPEYVACAVGVEYFPELGALVVANGGGGKGSVHAFDVKSASWKTLAGGLPMGVYHNFAEYNPVHKLVILGGGNGSRDLYRLDRDGTVTTLKPAPVGVGVMQTLFTVDPTSGDYLVFGKGGTFHVYDALKDEWSAREGDVPIFAPVRTKDNKVWHTNAVPVGPYGVVMFVKYYHRDPDPQAWVYLYKHAR